MGSKGTAGWDRRADYDGVEPDAEDDDGQEDDEEDDEDDDGQEDDEDDEGDDDEDDEESAWRRQDGKLQDDTGNWEDFR